MDIPASTGEQRAGYAPVAIMRCHVVMGRFTRVEHIALEI